MAEKANHLHIIMHLFKQISILSRGEHIKRFPERHVPHDIKAQIVEPSCHIDRRADSLVDRINELIGIFHDPWLIRTEG